MHRLLGAADDPNIDFRRVGIPPSPADLHSKATPYLRPIITKGPYTSVDHLLDINFRLLREDYIRPIRDGLMQFRRRNMAGAYPSKYKTQAHTIGSEAAVTPDTFVTREFKATPSMEGQSTSETDDASNNNTDNNNGDSRGVSNHDCCENGIDLPELDTKPIETIFEEVGSSGSLSGNAPDEEIQIINIAPDDNGDFDMHPKEAEMVEAGHVQYLTENSSPVDCSRFIGGYTEFELNLLEIEGTAGDILPPVRRDQELNVYTNVSFIRTVCMANVGVLHKMSIRECLGELRKVNWNATKRLLNGSMVILSSDNFRTFIVAVVVVRRPLDLSHGTLFLRVLDGGQQLDPAHTDNRFKKYVVAESPAYFEAYRHFLQGLQKSDVHLNRFFKYFVDIVKEVDAPQYLSESSVCSLQCFQKAGGPVIPNCKFLDKNTWPSAEALQLDDAQYKALQTALTRELALIQGPPGTGKTYLGLKIVNVLLDSARINMTNGPSIPILVMCHTNHALDQFLEGTLAFCSDGVVRVGGRSKSEKLEHCTLHNVKHRLRSERKIPHQVHKSKIALLEEMKACGRKTEQWSAMLDDSRTRIMNHQELRMLMESCYFDQFTFNTSIYNSLDSARGLTEWLGLVNYGPQTNVAKEWVPRPGMKAKASETTIHRGGWNIAVDGGGNQRDRSNTVGEVMALEEMEMRLEENVIDVDEHLIGYHMDRISSVVRRLVFSELDEPFDSTGIIFEDYELLNHNTSKANLASAESQQKKMIAQKLRVRRAFRQDEVNRLGDVWQLSSDDRWRLYRYWLAHFQKTCEMEVSNGHEQYEALNRKLIELEDLIDLHVLSAASIIGMTTTGAAKNQRLLLKIGARIVLVEEAAEVLEANLLATLNIGCQHIILIGDQQQLRPCIAVHQLSIQYHFDVSLFERLINNDVHYEQLVLQYRMRPEISALLVPHIYPELANHESVLGYGDVSGMVSNVFFFDHKHRESTIPDSHSKCNAFEAKLLVQLCFYLVLQTNPASSITILATYTAQLLMIKQNLEKYPRLKDVTCTVVDSYQGKENDIVLLSLVRSNEKNVVGFLKSDNRVCVALSRAKKAFYCIGNFDLLVANTDIWKNIVGSLEKDVEIGPSLKIRCYNHPTTINEVRVDTDFSQNTSTDCFQPCNKLRSCGHRCPTTCHFFAFSHTNLLCRQPCPKKCRFGHACLRYCYEDCGPCGTYVKRPLRCGHNSSLTCHENQAPYCLPGCSCGRCHCNEKVPFAICSQGHLIYALCAELPFPGTVPKCTENVSLTKSCGHAYLGSCCLFTDAEECTELVAVTCELGHRVSVPCHLTGDPERVRSFCFVMLNMKCGHARRLNCREINENNPEMERSYRTDSNCQEKAEAKCENGHLVKGILCHETQDTGLVNRSCQEKCTKLLDCLHSCTEKCGDACTTECKVEVSVKFPCGHEVPVFCFLSEDQRHLNAKCKAPCQDTLVCGHACSGNCVDCHQGRMHVICKVKRERIQICGHKILVGCGMTAQPCLAACGTQCYHRRCRRRCCMSCEPCRMPCQWYCKHHSCSKLCFELCDRPPCDHPCQRQLHCGHACIGYCGEPCPRLCRVCNRHQVCEVFFGNENRPDARFVLLENCGHAIESSFMDSWIMEDDGHLDSIEQPWPASPSVEERGRYRVIRMKLCPRCYTPITQNLRYGNHLKRILANVAQVKQRIFEEFSALQDAVRNGTLHKEIRDVLDRLPTNGFLYSANLQLRSYLGQNRFRLFGVNLIRNKLMLLKRMADMSRCIDDDEADYLYVEKFVELEKWIVQMDDRQEKYGELALFDLARELVRGIYLQRMELGTRIGIWQSPLYSTIRTVLSDTTPFKKPMEAIVMNGIQELVEFDILKPQESPVHPVELDQEVVEIRRTLILNTGRWFLSDEGQFHHCPRLMF